MSEERDPRVVAVAEKLALAYPYGFNYVKSGPSGADYHAAIVAVKALDEMAEYEYSVVETYLLLDQDTSEPHHWYDKAKAEEWLKSCEAAYASARLEGKPVNFTSKIVKRRKAGKVEDA